ncbi:unnamed protein product [Phytophthora lilii]|uniref:Unnamed protein product n=1 Tax=Phytophthora lilii TaxID=2077276 RepID=A0A9W6TQN2_9STRA|nr:unnamed protein product [Phytophthora lilii]
MDSDAQLPSFTVAIYVGVLAGLVVFAVAFTMLRVYGYRHRLSTVTVSASWDADAEPMDNDCNALIATTLSVLGSPLPDFPEESPSTRKMSVLSSFGRTRWEQARCFVDSIRERGWRVWSALRQRLAARRDDKAAAKDISRISQIEVEIAMPCDTQLKPPVTPPVSSQYASQVSSKFQLSLFTSPTSGSVGMI